MLFSKRIPEGVLEQDAPRKLVEVLDELNKYKQGIIADSLRVHNPLLCTDAKWLRYQLYDHGFGSIPDGVPVAVLQQLLLNADTIMGLRGSKLGLKILLGACCLGSATFNDANFRTNSTVLLLDSRLNGYITEDSGGIIRFLSEDSSEINPATYLSVVLASQYFDGNHPEEAAAIKAYVKVAIERYIPFHTNFTLNILYRTNNYLLFNSLLNGRFISHSDHILVQDGLEVSGVIDSQGQLGPIL